MLKFGKIEGRLNLPLMSETEQILESIIRFICKSNGTRVLDLRSFTEKQEPVGKVPDWPGYEESSSPENMLELLPSEKGWRETVPVKLPAHCRDCRSAVFSTGC